MRHKINSKFKKILAAAFCAVLAANLCNGPMTANAAGTSILFGSWSNNATNHAGSVVEFQVVDASGISFNLSNYSNFRLMIDGGTPQAVSQGWYKLDPGTHEICLFTESITDRNAGVTFHSADIYGGSFMPTTKEHYLFIGDSLWEGTNSLGIGEGQDSFINSIPFQLAKDMDVIPITVAAPGSGIFATEYFSTIEDMAFQNTINANPTKIFISAGTNDVKLGVPDDMELYSFQHLVDTIQSKFPYSQIYVLVPFFAQCYTNPIHQLTGVTVIETAGWPLTYTDYIHPDSAAAKYAADMIASQL